MKQLSTVIGFEYKGYIHSKAFRVITAIFVGALLILAFIPQISGVSKEHGIGVGKGEKQQAIILLGDKASSSPTVKQAFSTESLNEYLSSAEWIDGNAKGYDERDMEKQIKDEDVAYAVYYDEGVSYKFYAPGNKLNTLMAVPEVDAYVTGAVKYIAIDSLPKDEQGKVQEIANLTAVAEVVGVGGNAENNFWLGYVLMLFLLYMIIAYANFVSAAVVTEKTSKAMELLITAAKPVSLMAGKVIGVGLAALTQMAVIIAAVVVGLMVNLDKWKEFQPGVFDVLNEAHITYEIVIVLVLNFILGFFLYSFILAALASTVSRPEEASTVTLIPTLLVVAALALGFLSLSGVIGKSTAAVLSYIPPFTPFVLTSRYCTNDVSSFGLVMGILALAAGVVIVAWLAAKIYRVGVMMYGSKGGLKKVVQAIKG